MGGKKKGNVNAEPPPKPTKGVVYVAKEYPPWQKTVLVKLREMYESNGHTFPENKEIMNVMKTEETVKKHMKKLMPYVAHCKGQVMKNGTKALDLQVPFDEMYVLMDNLTYLVKSIELEAIEVLPSSEAEQKIQEECSPGKPFTVFKA